MLSRITGRSFAEEARRKSANILLNMRDRRWSWLGHTMYEARLGRKVLLNCVKPNKELLFGDIPSLDVEKAIDITRDREEWKKT